MRGVPEGPAHDFIGHLHPPDCPRVSRHRYTKQDFYRSGLEICLTVHFVLFLLFRTKLDRFSRMDLDIWNQHCQHIRQPIAHSRKQNGNPDHSEHGSQHRVTLCICSPNHVFWQGAHATCCMRSNFCVGKHCLDDFRGQVTMEIKQFVLSDNYNNVKYKTRLQCRRKSTEIDISLYRYWRACLSQSPRMASRNVSSRKSQKTWYTV